ncbi:zf-HC2 domain-containing protein [Kitasatospora sp. NPDC089797]|uniref:zf-HC2 domain-containing protein n=1 Tax=Kitasatospora sp. NPDC089797 TaxID=3155298 RepID=UPI003423AD15
MRCAQFRTALSARLDGEPGGLPTARVDKHLARCAGCRDWRDRAGGLRARTRATDADGPSTEWSAGLWARLEQAGPAGEVNPVGAVSEADAVGQADQVDQADQVGSAGPAPEGPTAAQR